GHLGVLERVAVAADDDRAAGAVVVRLFGRLDLPATAFGFSDQRLGDQQGARDLVTRDVQVNDAGRRPMSRRLVSSGFRPFAASRVADTNGCVRRSSAGTGTVAADMAWSSHDSIPAASPSLAAARAGDRP